MTRHPFDSNELGRRDPELEQVGERVERYAVEVRGEPPIDLSQRIRAAIDREPHRWEGFGSWLATWSGPARAVAGGAFVVLVVAGAVALGQLIERTREQVGSTPSPSVIVTPSPSPSPSPTPSPTPTPTPTATPTPSPSMTPEASPSDEVEFETPEPDESSGSGNSGPGGGGGNSGPGGGGGEP